MSLIPLFAYNSKQTQTTPYNMTPILQNIKSLSYIDASLLHGMTVIPGRGVMLNIYRNFTPLPVVGLAMMEVSSKVENKSRLYTTTIKGLLCEHFDPANRKLAFLATTVLNQTFLIGSDESPYPVANTSDAFPDKETDVSGCTLSVEYTDSLGLLRVLDGSDVFL